MPRPRSRKSTKFLIIGDKKRDILGERKRKRRYKKSRPRPRVRARKGHRPRPRSRAKNVVRRPDHVIVPVRGGHRHAPSPRAKNNTCCSGINAVLWSVTILAIALIASTLIIFRKDIFGSKTKPPDNGGVGPDEEAKRRRQEEENRKREERERLEREENERRRLEKIERRRETNNRRLTVTDLGLQGGFCAWLFGGSTESRLRIAECEYNRLVPRRAILKRDREKLWAVALILYTNKGAGGTNHQFYSEVNKSLREGSSKYKKYAEILREALDYLIKHQTVEVPEVLYRGVPLDHNTASKIEANNGADLGNGSQFMSTTTRKSKAREYAQGTYTPGRNPRPFFLEITGCTDAAEISAYGLKGEEEWLIPYEVKFKTSIDPDSSSRMTLVHMEQIQKSDDGVKVSVGYDKAKQEND